MMPIHYAIINKNNGEIEGDCGLCAYGMVGSEEDFNANKARLDENHIILEVTPEEKLAIRQSIIVNQNNKLIHSKKIDIAKVSEKIKDRKDKSKSAVIERGTEK